MTKPNSVLRYTIIVMGPAYGTQAAFCAYQFVSALVKTPHHIESIFFYSDGVYNANSYVQPANDEFNLIKAWQTLAHEYHLNLDVCTAAAFRRGVIEDQQQNNLMSGFRLSGLSSLSEAMAKSDRVIQL